MRALMSSKRVKRRKRLLALGALVLVVALVFVHHLVPQQTASERERLVAGAACVFVLLARDFHDSKIWLLSDRS